MENILLFGKKFKVKISVKVVCFAATHRHNSLIRFFTLINTFFTSNNAIFNTITHTPLRFPPPLPHKNRYTRKQPTHFSMAT